MGSSWVNLVARVFRLFGQRLVAGRDSGEFKKKLNFLIGCFLTGCIVLLQKSCSNKIPVPQSLLATNRWPKSLRTLGIRLLMSFARLLHCPLFPQSGGGGGGGGEVLPDISSIGRYVQIQRVQSLRSFGLK